MKEIILFTIPHSGTHTIHYLFKELCGINVWWSHFEEPKFLDELLDSEHDGFVHVQTYRPEESLLRSYASRRGEAYAGKQVAHLTKCLEIREEYRKVLSRRFGSPHMLFIEESNAFKTKQAEGIFAALGAEPTEAAKDYMLSWPKINSHQTKGNDAKKDSVKQSIRKYHIRQLKERNNGT